MQNGIEGRTETVRQSYYAVIPANVRYDEMLTPNAKLLYGEITALCNEKGFCWASNQYFAELYRVSKVSVSKWVASLAEQGYIRINFIYREGSKEILNRCISIVCDPVKEKLNTPIKEKFKENNTVINNNPLTPLKGGVGTAADATEPVTEPNHYKAKEVTAKPKESTNVPGNCYTKNKAECFEQFCKAYLAKRRNKAESKKHYYAYLNGSKRDRTDGAVYSYDHVQLFLAAERYMAECYEKQLEPEKIKLMSSFLNERIRDYVDKTQPQYEAMMREHYGEDWQKVRFRYE